MTEPGKTSSTLRARRLGRWAVLASILVIGAATLRPGTSNESTGRFCLVCGTYGGVDAILNVALFVPFGLGLGLIGIRLRTAALLGFLASVAIELLQFQFVPGRDAGISDILTNSFGTALGFVLGRYGGTLLRPGPRVAAVLSASWLAIWLMVQALVAYSLTPSLPEGEYYAQIARARPGVFVFPGRVLAANVGPAPLRAGNLDNAATVRSLLGRREGAPFVVSVIPTGETPGRAEIVVISGPRLVGIISFEQDARSLIFGLRTGAERLRLRPYEFRLAGVFDDAARGLADSTELTGHYTTTEVNVTARSHRMSQAERFVPRLSWGWRLLIPFRLYVENDIRGWIVSIAFLALMFLPAGYWGRLAFPREGRDARPHIAIGILVAVMAAGFVLIPVLMGLRPAAWWEFLALGAGIALGYWNGTWQIRSSAPEIRGRRSA